MAAQAAHAAQMANIDVPASPLVSLATSGIAKLFGETRLFRLTASPTTADSKSEWISAGSAFTPTDLIVLVFGMGGCRHTKALLPNLSAGLNSTIPSAGGDTGVLTIVYVPTNHPANSLSASTLLSSGLPSNSLLVDPTALSLIAKLKSQFRVFGFPWIVITDRNATVLYPDASDALYEENGRTAFAAWRKHATALRHGK
jgi:hypothetical protein